MGLESGVSGYVVGRAEVSTGFPIDDKGRWHIACKYCRFFNGKRCVITNEIVPFPETHIGNECTFKFEGEEEE